MADADELWKHFPAHNWGPWGVSHHGKRVIIDQPLPDSTYELIAQAIREQPELTLVIGHHYGEFEFSREFLRLLECVQKFDCYLLHPSDWSFLDCLPDSLNALVLGATLTNPGSIQHIARFRNLRELALEGQRKGIEAVASLTNLEELELRSITLADLSILVGLEKLWSLDLKLGGTNNLALLPELRSVRYLELWMIRGLSDLSPISGMKSVEYLHLEALRRVTELPDLSKLSSLKGILLQNMKGLRDLRPLRSAPALEELFVWQGAHMKIDDFKVLVGHPTLKRMSIGLGSDKKNNAVERLLNLAEALTERFEDRANPHSRSHL